MITNINNLNPTQKEINNILDLFNSSKFTEVETKIKNEIINYPNSNILFNILGATLFRQNKLEKAIECYKKSISIEPNYAQAYNNLGIALQNQNRTNEAIDSYKKAISIKNDFYEALNNLGNAIIELGKSKEAIDYLKKALKINPLNSKAHYNLSNLINYNISGKQHSSQLLLNLKSSKFENDKMYYCFALGKVYEDKKKYKKSLQYFKKGNLIKRNSFSYTISDDQKLYSNIKKIFNQDFVLSLKNLGFNNHLPIFVVGMPRSGTSLIEQILSSHPDVFGAGEINDLESIILEFFSDNNKIYSLKKLSGLDHKIFKVAGQKYCLKLKKRSVNKKLITNKLTLNFRWIGLIKLILPNAKIVHCKRHPYDTSLSIFQKFFPIYGNEYTFDLVEIAQYFKLYLDLMGYWKKILPNSFYEISYEDLINDQENQITKLLKYCNLPFSEKCYKFSNTNRIVKTSSNTQVRQKIYRSSMGKWKYYKKGLFELINILNIPS